MDTGDEKIEDSALVAELRKQARRVHLESVLVSILLTALFTFIV